MVQYMFTERTHYVGRVIKTRNDGGELYVDFGCFGKKWVKFTKCLVISTNRSL